MKFSKILSAAAAIAAAGMMVTTARAELVVPDAQENFIPGSGMWLVVLKSDGSDPTKPVRDLDIDYAKIDKLSVTFTVEEEDQIFWDGGTGGALFLSMNGGTVGGKSGEGTFDTYNWISQGYWGVSDEDLGITTWGEDQEIQTEKVGDYTYKLTSNSFKNAFADGEEPSLVQLGMQEWGNGVNRISIQKFELLDASGNVMVTIDGKGNVTIENGSSAPSTPDTTPSNDNNNTGTPANNVDTGVEGVAAVVGVAALAAGAVVLSRKRK